MIRKLLRRVVRPVTGAVRLASSLSRNAAVRATRRPPAGTVRVSYGHSSLPERTQPAFGGIVKLQDLQRRYPHEARGFNVLYLVTSNLPHQAVSLARAARAKGARVVVNQNGVAYRGWYGAGYERINAPMIDLLRMADHVFYQSRFCRQSADRFLGQRVGPAEVLYNAVDTKRFRPDPSRRDPSALTMLLGGTQTSFYRVDVALQVLAAVVAERPDATLLITGRFKWAGNEVAAGRELMDRARALGVAERIGLVGPYSQNEAPGIFQRAALLLHTKYNDPCPTVVLEALASGLPVVYSASGGVPELVGPDAGVGVPAELDWDRDRPPDPQVMAAAVLRAAQDAERMAMAARSRAEAFDVEPWLNRHQQVFEALTA